ncbi:GNAT family N-acetyltransferase [soil metagenome]
MIGVAEPDDLGRIPVAFPMPTPVPRPKPGRVDGPHPHMDAGWSGGLSIPIIQTDRLLLTALAEHHRDDWARIDADPRIAEWLGRTGQPDPQRAREDAWRAMALHAGHWALRGYGQWALVLRDDSDTLIGRAGLWHPEGWPGIEVGWTIAPDHQGQGYATEAGLAAIDFAFAHLVIDHSRLVDEVVSVTRPDNAASRRVMEKVGLTDTGTTLELRGHPQVLYRMTRDDWMARIR